MHPIKAVQHSTVAEGRFKRAEPSETKLRQATGKGGECDTMTCGKGKAPLFNSQPFHHSTSPTRQRPLAIHQFKAVQHSKVNETQVSRMKERQVSSDQVKSASSVSGSRKARH